MRGDRCEPAGVGRPTDYTENRREQQKNVAAAVPQEKIAIEQQQQQRSDEKLYAGVRCRRVLRADENDEKRDAQLQQRCVRDQRPIFTKVSMNL